MKKIDSYKKQLQQENFKHIYEWTDEPGTEYPAHSHKGPVALYVTQGSITFNIEGESLELKDGDRFDVPVGKEHTAKVSSEGCSFLIGEMIKGDS